MKSKILIIAMVALLVMLLVGAYALYGSLSEKEDKPDNLVIADGYVPPFANNKNTQASDTVTDEGAADTEDISEDSTASSDTQVSDSEKVDTDGSETQGTDTQPVDTQPADTEVKDTEPEDTIDPSLLAPDFTVYDENGKAYKLSDFFGKPIVLNFWASWCGPCQYEMPDFDAAYKKYGKDIHFIMVNLTDGSSETVKSASSFIKSKGYSFPVYYDTSLQASYEYGATSIPITFFIDSRGVVAAYGSGALDAETLERGISYIYVG